VELLPCSSGKSLGVCLLLAFGLHFSHVELERSIVNRTLDRPTWSLAPTTSRIVDLGYDQAVADVYWLAFIQYVGNSKARRLDNYKDAEQFLDLIVGIDPSLVQAYYFAAFIIGSERRNPLRAAEIIESGIRANPDNWYLPFIAGINQYLYANNEIAAAKYYRMAARLPGAPKWMRRQADILSANIPSILKDLNTWDSIYKSAENEVIVMRARERLVSLWFRVYKTSPTEEVRKRALEHLRDLGVDDVPH
jgi:hypothetical protein